MNKTQRDKFLSLIKKHTCSEGLNTSAIPDVSFFTATTTGIPLPDIYKPSLCLIVQGSKDVLLGEKRYHYGPGEYLVASVDLPIIGRITEATPETPYFVIRIDIDTQQLSELLIHTEHSTRSNNNADSGLFIGTATDILSESILRLIRLLETPQDIPVLSKQMLREVYYRILCSDYGETIAQTTLKGSHMQRISNVIQKMKREFHKPTTIEELASLAGMSTSSFHAHFKAVTAMSPLQFQKSLRLLEARSLMIANNTDATTTAYQVGYESPSQFNREYARMFGNPPVRDISILREQGKHDR